MVSEQMLTWSRKKLDATFNRFAAHHPPAAYGFVIHARRHRGRPVLGLITPSGESLALNERLLRSLDGIPMWLFGHARIGLGAGTVLASARGDRLELPLTSMIMRIATFEPATSQPSPTMDVDAVVKAEQLARPLLIVTRRRPPGFPR